jgi:hypothetical protein
MDVSSSSLPVTSGFWPWLTEARLVVLGGPVEFCLTVPSLKFIRLIGHWEVSRKRVFVVRRGLAPDHSRACSWFVVHVHV